MGKWSWLPVAAALAPLTALAQTAGGPASAVAVANLDEDVQGLSQRLADLSVRVEQLEADNAALQKQMAGPGAVTGEQLEQAIADLRHYVQQTVAASKSDVLKEVDARLDNLERLAAQATAQGAPAEASPAAAAPASGRFSTNFPKEGVSYVVQKGDTVASIAKKTGAHFRDIVNANRLSDPSLIRVGQTLFIPLAGK